MAEAGTEFLMTETVPLGGQPTSLVAGLLESRDPRLVSMVCLLSLKRLRLCVLVVMVM